MLNAQQLIGKVVDERTETYRREDTILYALACGFGHDPLDRQQLKFVYEEKLEALPALCLVLGYPGFWLREPEYGADWKRVLHAEEQFEIVEPLPVSGTIHSRTTVDQVVDRGPDKGAFIYSRKELRVKDDGRLLATVHSSTFARGDGGCGGPDGPRPAPVAMPTRAPDLCCELPTLPQQALLYRLCGDFNPLHADPDVARAAGFERPILHGRCTLGVAQHALLKTCCDYDSRRLRGLRLRFSAPFLPGETLRTKIWREGNQAWFEAESVERGVTVLSNGLARIEG